MKILVTGANGTVGRQVVATLQEKNIDYLAGVRDLEKSKEILGADSKLIHFDFEDETTFANATEDVTGVFLLAPPLTPNVVDLVSSFIDYLKKIKLTNVTYMGAFGMEDLEDKIPVHGAIIEKLKAKNFDLTILKPSFFSQNFKTYEYENIMERNMTFMPAGNGKVGFVDTKDIAEMAVATLTQDGHSHKSYVITGPELLSYHDAAKTLTKVLGREISYPEPSPETFTHVLKESGAPEFIAHYMVEVYGMIRNNKVNKLSEDVEKVLGRKPHSLEVALKRDWN